MCGPIALGITSLAMGVASTTASTAVSVQQAKAQVEANQRTSAAAQAAAIQKTQAEVERQGQIAEATDRERLRRQDALRAARAATALLNEKRNLRGTTAERMDRDLRRQGLQADDQLVANAAGEIRQSGRRIEGISAERDRIIRSLPAVNPVATGIAGGLSIGSSITSGLAMPIDKDGTMLGEAIFS